MNKILLVISREYFSRVRKRSFIVMTILGPLLIAAMYGIIIYIAISEQDKPHTVMVVDDSYTGIGNALQSYNIKRPESRLKFSWKYDDFETAKDSIFSENETYNSILYIPENPVAHPGKLMIRYRDRPDENVKNTIESEMEKIIEEQMMISKNINREDLEDLLRLKISINSKALEEGGKEAGDSYWMSYVVGLIAGILIYMFVLLYGVQVLRGVMEEKTNRIVEVMISSIRPFQLMMGKIIGIALVGLTQFLIWVVFTGVVITVIGVALAPTLMEQVQSGSMQTQSEVSGVNIGEMLNLSEAVNFPLMIIAFLLYFIGGYLLYASLFAAVGSAVDSETDSQQFMLPITLPLILAIFIGQMALKNPDGTLATVFSMVPLTSPIVMMVRIPFGVPLWEVALSLVFLAGGFLLTTWLAARIYKTGILMYGKKVTYRELWKWLFYKS